MRRFYHSLNEKDRRRFAGLEALRFGSGGRSYIARVLGCSRNTVSKGAREVSGLPTREVEQRIRKTGGGRKRYTVVWGAVLDEKSLAVLRDHTAGDPMDETVRWTNLTPGEIVKALRDEYGITVSKFVVGQLRKKHNCRRRKAKKKTSLKQELKNRNEQFENILRLKADFVAAGNPILSMDTKKKEYIGNFYRDGHLYTLAELHTYDHDFHSYAEGVIIPHSLYDLGLNIDKVYETGRKVAADFKETMRIVFDDFLPQWNYRAILVAQLI
ncbi:MAG: hypothetical protein JW953_02135 [Anaerolineae bacterium]|nr:hypothetical protein [Anaerolineae bacterium]